MKSSSYLLFFVLFFPHRSHSLLLNRSHCDLLVESGNTFFELVLWRISTKMSNLILLGLFAVSKNIETKTGRIIGRIQQRNQSSIIVSFRSLLRPRVTNATLLSKNIPIPILSLLLLLFGVNQAEKIIERAIALSLKVFADFQHVFLCQL